MRDPRRMPRFQLLAPRTAHRTLAEALCSVADFPGAASGNLAASRGPHSEIQADPAPCPSSHHDAGGTLRDAKRT
jgi:hypothetical protein